MEVVRMSNTHKLNLALLAATALAGSACSSVEDGPTAPQPETPEVAGNVVRGEAAFATSCAECHNSRDGFDLAHFQYPVQTVVRRALAHVDTLTSHDISAYIESLNPRLSTRGIPPFQPGGKISRTSSPSAAANDAKFWETVFGTSYFPAEITAEEIRAIDPRDHPIPFRFPEWSAEASDEDWLPDTPLHREILKHNNGAGQSAINDYYRDPSEERLVHTLSVFQEAAMSADGICMWKDPDPCFNARRWMATFAAQHYLRSGEPDDVPVEVAQVWWNVGESAIAQQTVAKNSEERAEAFRNGSRWMYLGFVFAPEAFEEPASYMGTFLGSFYLNRDSDRGFPHISTFAALRRMVGNGRAHQTNPGQMFQDGEAATGRAPGGLKLDIAEFSLNYFVDKLNTDPPTGLTDAARDRVNGLWVRARGSGWRDPDQFARITGLRDQVLGLLPR